MNAIDSLKSLREQVLGFRSDTVARECGLTAGRLAEIEGGEPPTVFEIEALASVYGIDADILAERPIRLHAGDAIQTLALLDEFRLVGDSTRVRIIKAATAARDVRLLRRLLGPDDPVAQFNREFRPMALRADMRAPHRQGADIAVRLRRQLGLGTRPIPSLRDLIQTTFPSIVVLYASLGQDGPAGLTFGDPIRGPTIVLNTDGKNRNPLVRRFSLAHELCHLALDWRRPAPLAFLSGYLNDAALQVERRANAFAVRFLCPESVLKKVARDVGSKTAVAELGKYGLPYAALRLYLRNEANITNLPPLPSPELGLAETRPEWRRAEAPFGIDGFPLVGVATERRTHVAHAAARAYSAGKIGRAAFAHALGLTPADPIEQVLDFLALDSPSACERAPCDRS